MILFSIRLNFIYLFLEIVLYFVCIIYLGRKSFFIRFHTFFYFTKNIKLS